MLKFFGKNYFVQYTSLLVLGLALWSPAFSGCIYYPDLNFHSGIFAESLSFLRNISLNISTVIAFLLILIFGYLTNKLAELYDLVEKHSLYVFLFTLILSSLFVLNMILAPHIIAGFLILLLLSEIFKHDSTSDNLIMSFNAGFYIGLLTLIYYPSLFLLLFFWISVSIIGGVNWRNFVVASIGVLLVMFGEYLFYFFKGDESLYFLKLENAFKFSFDFFNSSGNNISIYYLIILILFLFIGLFAFNSPVKLSVRQRKFLSVSGLLTIFISIILFFFIDSMMIFLAFPAVAIILGNISINISDSKRINILFLIVLILIAINNWITCL